MLQWNRVNPYTNQQTSMMILNLMNIIKGKTFLSQNSFNQPKGVLELMS